MIHPYFEGARHARILAHRGLVPATDDPTLWENTAGAFTAAQAAGAEFIETDCQLTADGEVVLFHDDTLERLTGDPRAVSQVRTAELESIFADHGGLLTVASALDAFPDVRFNIDVKTRSAAEPIGKVIAAHAHRVLITSFSDADRLAALESIMRAGAAIRPAMSGGRSTILSLRARSALRLSPARLLADIDAVQIPERHAGIPILTPALIRTAHRHGVEVHVWTINDVEDMNRLLDAGVDGIVTDRADLALGAL